MVDCEEQKQQQMRLRKLKIRKEKDAGSSEEGEDGGVLSPMARLFLSPSFRCYIIVKLGTKTRIDPILIKAGLPQTLLKHPRFSSKVVIDDKRGGEKRWVRVKVNLEEHVVVPDIDMAMVASPDQFVEDYMFNVAKTSMDLSKPLWSLHLLNIRTSDAQAVAIIHIHHSIGDGVSLISLLLACSRQSSDLNALPTLPVQKQSNPFIYTGIWSFILLLARTIRLLWNTFEDVLMFIATTLFLKDTNTPMKGAPDVGTNPKRFVHRTISLDDIKLVKNAMHATINDVLLGVTQAGITRYLNRRFGIHGKNNGTSIKSNDLPQNIRFRSVVSMNTRPPAKLEVIAGMVKEGKLKWGNHIGYVILPFNFGFNDEALDHIRKAKSTVDRKKVSLEAIFTQILTKFVFRLFGEKAVGLLTHRVFSNTTMMYSNVCGPMEEISFVGHPIAYFAPSICGLPHALTIHFQSYVNKMIVSMAVDESVIPDPHQFCDDLQHSLQLLVHSLKLS